VLPSQTPLPRSRDDMGQPLQAKASETNANSCGVLPRPVPYGSDMKTILTPVDFSNTTDGVVATASALARSLDGRVVLLNITEPPSLIMEESAFTPDLDEMMKQTSHVALMRLEQLRDQLENDFVKADAIHLVGMSVPLIIEQAHKLRSDLIVIGSNGHSAVYELVLGSTTAGVIINAPCPVVVVPPPKRIRRDWRNSVNVFGEPNHGHAGTGSQKRRNE
jgi:nucleotide-binding universal stress UspA family protein